MMSVYYNKILERVENLETMNKEILEYHQYLHGMVKAIGERLKRCEDRKITVMENKPHECPVCKGMCTFAVFGENRQANCPTCKGKGIVWHEG